MLAWRETPQFACLNVVLRGEKLLNSRRELPQNIDRNSSNNGE